MSSNVFKDRAMLLAVGIVAAGMAWAFWHYLGNRAFKVLMVISIIVLVSDNRRLRRQVAALQEEGRP